jgi:hypothetical protein
VKISLGVFHVVKGHSMFSYAEVDNYVALVRYPNIYAVVIATDGDTVEVQHPGLTATHFYTRDELKVISNAEVNAINTQRKLDNDRAAELADAQMCIEVERAEYRDEAGEDY